MAKMKVHELAKELDKQSKELIAFLKEKGIDVKVAQSSIEEDAVALVRAHFGKEKPVEAETGKKETTVNPEIQKPAASAKTETSEKKGEEAADSSEQPKTGKFCQTGQTGKTGAIPPGQAVDAAVSHTAGYYGTCA